MAHFSNHIHHRPAFDQSDIFSGQGKFHPQVSADGAGAYNTYFHVFGFSNEVIHRTVIFAGANYLNSLLNVPIPSIMISILLPGFIEPTPTEVPQAITSPG